MIISSFLGVNENTRAHHKRFGVGTSYQKRSGHTGERKRDAPQFYEFETRRFPKECLRKTSSR